MPRIPLMVDSRAAQAMCEAPIPSVAATVQSPSSPSPASHHLHGGGGGWQEGRGLLQGLSVLGIPAKRAMAAHPSKDAETAEPV